MVTISSINGVNTQAGQPGLNQTADLYSRNLQNQIANAQKRLQELSADKGMTAEEKLKKRQEIQKQINDLNMELRQHQIEQRKEKQQAKGSGVDDIIGCDKEGQNGKGGSQGAGLSQTSMQTLISADAAVGQARIQGNVASKMEGRAGVLKIEIKQDAALGGDTSAKEEELAKVEQKATDATASQMGTLGKANENLKEAAEDDRKADEQEKAEGSDEDKISEERPGIYYTSVDVRI